MSDEFTLERRHSHCAVSLDNFIIVIGGWCRHGVSSTRVIWIYNMYTEEWKREWKYSLSLPDLISSTPEAFSGAVAAAIDKTIYTFGGRSATGKLSNALWKLSKTKGGCFTWSFNKPQYKKKSPSPRIWHTGWGYAGKLWIFGGFGNLPEGYLIDNGDFEGSDSIISLRNNQLLCFDPNIETWTNPQCFGSIPTPRAFHASAIINDKVWLFGGKNKDGDHLGDMFELRMSSLTWSQIQTAEFHPKARAKCTLTAAADDKLVLHGGWTKDKPWAPLTSGDTWIMDLTSYSLRQFTSRKDHAREWHTGSTGLNHSIIIIGGHRNHLDIHGAYSIIFNVMLRPKSLQHVAMQAIHKHQDELPLNYLPWKLLSLLDVSVKDQNVGSESDHVNKYIMSSRWGDFRNCEYFQIYVLIGLTFLVWGLKTLLWCALCLFM